MITDLPFFKRAAPSSIITTNLHFSCDVLFAEKQYRNSILPFYPNPFIEHIQNLDEIIVSETSIEILFVPITLHHDQLIFNTMNDSGFTRRELLESICSGYLQIYSSMLSDMLQSDPDIHKKLTIADNMFWINSNQPNRVCVAICEPIK